MLSFLFGWRNASKCMRLVKQAKCRLKLLHNKTFTIARHLRHDVALLLQIPHPQRALSRAEQLFRYENLLPVYQLLDHFCDFIIIHFSYIRRHRELPNDINEAVSSLVFASARCGDIPELTNIRQLFGERYGQRFLATALHLLPGNLVNSQIKEKLSITSVPDDVKFKLVDEIARDHRLRPEVLALEYTSEYHKKVKESSSSRDQERKAAEASSSQVDAEAQSEAELNTFTTTDFNIQERGERKSFDKACVGGASSRISDEVEEQEACVGEGQRVFRFRSQQQVCPSECSMDEKSRRRGGKRSRRRSWENVMMMSDTECFVYYNTPAKRSHRKLSHHRHKPCCVIYNVFTYPEHSVEIQKSCRQEYGRSNPNPCSHVHPKLPDYDHLAAMFAALRRHRMPNPN